MAGLLVSEFIRNMVKLGLFCSKEKEKKTIVSFINSSCKLGIFNKFLSNFSFSVVNSSFLFNSSFSSVSAHNLSWLLRFCNKRGRLIEVLRYLKGINYFSRELIFAISRILDNYIGQKQRITPGDDRRNIKSRKLIPANINSLKIY